MRGARGRTRRARGGLRRRLPAQRPLHDRRGPGPGTSAPASAAWTSSPGCTSRCWATDDRYFSSKGHDAPGLYAVLIGLGRLDFELIHGLRRLGGLPGHPDVAATPEVVTNTGSLGMGISKAKGFVLADRLAGRHGRRLRPDRRRRAPGGPVLGVARPAANRGFERDHRRSSTTTRSSPTPGSREVSDLGDLEAKVARLRLGGRALRRPRHRRAGGDAGGLEQATDGPEADRRRHRSRAPASPSWSPHELPVDATRSTGSTRAPPARRRVRAARSTSCEARLAERLAALGADRRRAGRGRGARRDRRPPSAASGSSPPTARRSSDVGEREPRLVALDADLVLDTGLIPFRERFPERFFECGIAEQDMVSQAGAMALAGLLPVVPLVRLLPLDPAQRADLQQRHRGHQGHLRRLAGRAGARAARATRTSRCATSPRSARCPAWR